MHYFQGSREHRPPRGASSPDKHFLHFFLSVRRPLPLSLIRDSTITLKLSLNVLACTLFLRLESRYFMMEVN